MMATFHGLYYPYIHFQDEGWLKTAALYWDSMGRIAGPDTPLSDSDEVQRLFDAGFVQNQPPVFMATEEIAKPFSALLASRGEVLQQKFGVDANTSDDNLSAIYVEKINKELLKDLSALKLVRTRDPQDRWIEINTRLGVVYITALAEAMAPLIGHRPLAEEGKYHVAISGLTLERLTDALLNDDGMRREPQHQDTEIEGAMATIALRYVVPANPEAIPANEIIMFRKNYQEERGQFQAEVTKIIKELEYIKAMSNRDEILRHLQTEYDKRLAGKVKRLEEGMQRAKWNTIENAMAASWALPAGLGTVLTALGLSAVTGVGAAVMGVVGVGFVGWSILRKHRNEEIDLLKPTTEAYLYHAKKVLSPQALADKIYTDGRMLLP
jgi:uncharacterized protein DUF6236